jgi:hypothetical protein
VVLWSFNYPVVKAAVSHGFAPLVYATFRFGAGFLGAGFAVLVLSESLSVLQIAGGVVIARSRRAPVEVVD